MFAIVAILLPSFVGIKLMDHLLKSLKVKDIVIYYGILVLFTQGINNILVKYYYNINDTLWNSLNIGTDFFSIYILVSLIINVLITLLLVVIVKNIKFEVEVAYAKKNNVSNTKYQISIERIQGFVSAVLEKGANFERKDVVISTTNYERIESIVEQALINDPSIDGICCFCDPLAPYIYKAISHVGKKVGKDIKVIGYDDTELCETLEPKLTSIGYNSYKMGEICAQLLYKLTHGYKLGEFDFFLQEPEIVRRKSCGE